MSLHRHKKTSRCWLTTNQGRERDRRKISNPKKQFQRGVTQPELKKLQLWLLVVWPPYLKLDGSWFVPAYAAGLCALA
ncbi:hypothetical protein V6N13_024058 [Hibiscus sabdariffa]